MVCFGVRNIVFVCHTVYFGLLLGANLMTAQHGNCNVAAGFIYTTRWIIIIVIIISSRHYRLEQIWSLA